MRHTDILVSTKNPEVLDRTVNALGAAVVQDAAGIYAVEDGCYVVRVFGDPGFVEFAIEAQGYGKLCGRRGEEVL